ncbi:hypothetical protein J3F83DRAFT_727010 [Trichoderma novae-zelandiae]
MLTFIELDFVGYASSIYVCTAAVLHSTLTRAGEAHFPSLVLYITYTVLCMACPSTVCIIGSTSYLLCRG